MSGREVEACQVDTGELVELYIPLRGIGDGAKNAEGSRGE